MTPPGETDVVQFGLSCLVLFSSIAIHHFITLLSDPGYVRLEDDIHHEPLGLDYLPLVELSIKRKRWLNVAVFLLTTSLVLYHGHFIYLSSHQLKDYWVDALDGLYWVIEIHPGFYFALFDCLFKA